VGKQRVWTDASPSCRRRVGVRLRPRTAVLATVVAVVRFSAAAYTVVTTGPDDDFGYEGATLGVADFGGGGDFEGDAGVTALLV
jgi:hypothetical protein